MMNNDRPLTGTAEGGSGAAGATYWPLVVLYPTDKPPEEDGEQNGPSFRLAFFFVSGPSDSRVPVPVLGTARRWQMGGPAPSFLLAWRALFSGW